MIKRTRFVLLVCFSSAIVLLWSQSSPVAFAASRSPSFSSSSHSFSFPFCGSQFKKVNPPIIMHESSNVDVERTTKKSDFKSADELWTINGKLYDLTPWLKKHPGGQSVLDQTRGYDATAMFESYHAAYESEKGMGDKKKPNLGSMLKRYYVRDAKPSEQDLSVNHNWSQTPIYDKVKRDAQAYFKKHGAKAPWYLWIWYAFWVSLYAVLAVRWVTHGKISEGLVLGAAMFYGPGDIGHSGLHYELFKSGRLNVLLPNLITMWQFVPSGWTRQHVMMHHTRPTYSGDVDIQHTGFFRQFRMSRDSPWRWHYRFWPFLWPISYVILGFALWVVDASTLFVSFPYLTKYVRIKHFVDRWEYLKTLVQFLLPAALFSTVAYRHGPLVLAVPWMVFGAIFYTMAQMSHEVPQAQVDRTNVKDEWVMQQVRSCRGDFSTKSYFWTAASIGLNNQVVHHTFPSAHWIHYPALDDIVRNATGEHDGPKRNLYHSFRDHFALIHEMNTNPS